MNNNLIIEISNLGKTYSGSSEAALKNLNLKIRKGEVFGLLGPNGAGKTTTISILCNLIKPTSGSCHINGLSVQHEFHLIKPLIGVVSQDIALYKNLTASENLQYYGSMYGIQRKELKERIAYYLEVIGLTKVKNKKIKHFSGGMVRRINLLAGILHNPVLVVLDEPTVGIDVQSRMKILDHLAMLNSKGVSLLYSSHMMEEAERLCTRIAIIDYGEIIAKGTPAELINENSMHCNSLEDVFLHKTGRHVRD